jgi:hypothetical protein
MDPQPVAAIVRQLMRQRGFQFVDDDELDQAPDPNPPPASVPLVRAGLAASSTDHEAQGVDMVLDSRPDTFWSSTGSDADRDESLDFALAGPLCLLTHISVKVYKARFQWGEPLYPPQAISFQVGVAQGAFMEATKRYEVRATDAMQTFALPADVPVGGYLRVNLHGKRQRQMEDLLYYHAIEGVQAHGRVSTPAETARLKAWLKRALGSLPAPGWVPRHVAETAMAVVGSVVAAKDELIERVAPMEQ